MLRQLRRPRGVADPPISRVDWRLIEEWATAARAAGRLPSSAAASLRVGLACGDLQPALVALTGLDAIALNGGPTVRASLAAEWPAAVRGAAAGPAAAAAEQALADWGHAYASEGFAARSRDAAAGLGGAQREPTAAARRARAAAAAGPPPAAFQRGSDYQRTFLAIVSGGGAAATHRGGVQPPAPPAAAAAPKLRAAAARLRAAATDGPTANPASGDALEAAAGGRDAALAAVRARR